MKHLFNFFFRLFLAFLAAKLLTRIFGLASLEALLGITGLFLANIYLFDYLNYRSRAPWRRGWKRGPEPSSAPPPAAEEPPSES